MKTDVALAPLTTIGLGGPARFFLECASVDDIRNGVSFAREKGLPVHILGGGSNTIFSDDGFSGVVFKIDLKGVVFTEEDSTVVAEVAAGEVWDDFVVACIERGLAGVECLSGIPGLVGATPIQNVGAYGQEVADVIESVHLFDVESLEEVTMAGNECGFGYRKSRFKYEDKGKYIVTGVVYRLQRDGIANTSYPQVREAVDESSASIKDVREAVLSLRKRKSMVIDSSDPNTRSCGSFFENLQLNDEQLSQLRDRAKTLGVDGEVPTFEEGGITRVPSAWLIERAGFSKGMKEGGVGISENHNLALVNYDGTSKELIDFAEKIVKVVYENFGVRLVREPVLVD